MTISDLQQSATMAGLAMVLKGAWGERGSGQRMLAIYIKEKEVCSKWMNGWSEEAKCQGWVRHDYCEKCSN